MKPSPLKSLGTKSSAPLETQETLEALLQSEADKRARIKAYFSGQFHEQQRRWQRLQWFAKRALLILGGLLWAATVAISAYQAYQLSGQLPTNGSEFEYALVLTGFLAAGSALIFIARWRTLWQLVLRNPARVYCWLLLVPVTLVAAWASKHYLGFSRAWEQIMGSAAAAFFLVGFFFRSRALPPEEEMERALDAWLEQDIARHLSQVQGSLGLAIDANSREFVLKGFPKRERLGGAAVMARIGNDRRPRISPIGFLACILGSNGARCIEGAIDLTTGELTYFSLDEFGSWGIVSLGLVAGPSDQDLKGDGAGLVGKLTRVGVKPQPKRREVLTLGLLDGRRIEFVLRDRSLNDGWSGETEALNSDAELGGFWLALGKARLESGMPSGYTASKAAMPPV